MSDGTGEALRLFVALPVPGQVRDEVMQAVRPLRERWPHARWTDPAGWHLTLAFLGAVEQARVTALVEQIRTVVSASAPIDVELPDRAGTAGGRSGGRGIVWLPVTANPSLVRLAEDVRDACEEAGTEPDRGRPFRGHLTLCRLPRGRHPRPANEANRIAEAYLGRDVGWTASEVHLVASTRTSEGASYDTVAALPLDG